MNRGRPKLPIEQRKNNIVATSVDDETLGFLNQISENEDVTRSSVLRAIILTYKQAYDAEFEQAQG